MSRFTHASIVGAVIDIPAALVASYESFGGRAGEAFATALRERAARFLDHWELRIDGPSMNGRCALVLPVLRADGTPAALKLQDVDEETAGEPVALRVWDGDGAVRLLEADADTGTLLLERLDHGAGVGGSAGLPRGHAGHRPAAGPADGRRGTGGAAAAR
jgi:streptomycin 6-kinase